MMAILQKYKHILVLGRGGFGRQLGEMLEGGGWGRPGYLDDNAPGRAGWAGQALFCLPRQIPARPPPP